MYAFLTHPVLNCKINCMVFSFLNVNDVFLNDSNSVFWRSFAFCFANDLLLCPYFDFPFSLSDLSKT